MEDHVSINFIWGRKKKDLQLVSFCDQVHIFVLSKQYGKIYILQQVFFFFSVKIEQRLFLSIFFKKKYLKNLFDFGRFSYALNLMIIMKYLILLLRYARKQFQFKMVCIQFLQFVYREMQRKGGKLLSVTDNQGSRLSQR